MNKIILNFLLIISFVSCINSQRKQLVTDLTNDSIKYWYRYNIDTSKPYALGFCFNRNGTFVRYSNPGFDKKIRTFYNPPQIIERPVWKFINDSIFMFSEGDNYKIIFFNSDSIILKGLKSNGYLRLHRDEDQKTKPITGKSDSTLLTM